MNPSRSIVFVFVLAGIGLFTGCTPQPANVFVAIQGIEQARAEFDLPPGTYTVTANAEVVGDFADMTITVGNQDGVLIDTARVTIPTTDLNLANADKGSGSATVTVERNKQVDLSIPMTWRRGNITQGFNVEITHNTPPAIYSMSIPGAPFFRPGDPISINLNVTNDTPNTTVAGTAVNTDIGVSQSIFFADTGNDINVGDVNVSQFSGSTVIGTTTDGPILVSVRVFDGTSATHLAAKFIAVGNFEPRDVLLNDAGDSLSFGPRNLVGAETLIDVSVVQNGLPADFAKVQVFGIDQSGQIVTAQGQVDASGTFRAALAGDVRDIQAMATFVVGQPPTAKFHVVTSTAANGQ